MTRKRACLVSDVTRDITRPVERELWARAAGRCQFSGCNRIVFKSPITQERVNISEKAHIYSFSKHGPRGWGPLFRNTKQLNEIANLLLLCHDCHKKIDQDVADERYSAALLQSWKQVHEDRIAVVTGIDANKKTLVVCYGANIGDHTSTLPTVAVIGALFPDWYPASEQPIRVSMSWEGKDSESAYWTTEAKNLADAFDRQIRPVLDMADPYHVSLFALAPMPLLVNLGAKLTDKIPVEVYQLHREPYQTWNWMPAPTDEIFEARRPTSYRHQPVLLISLSDAIAQDRVTAVLGTDVSIWEVTVAAPHNDFLKARHQLSEFRQVIRRLLVDIGRAHGKNTPLAIFPAMPVACAVELGRVRMPKADSQWTIYDFNSKTGRFIPAITIGSSE